MAHGFKPVDREQQFLLPPDIREWLPQGHLARFVIDTVDQLDLSAVVAGYRLGGAGRQAYHPAMLTGLLLYAYAIGVRSSRAIERACETDVAFRVIAANQRPDHATIARFRADHQAALEGLHVQVLGLCVRAGLVDARVVAVDSTKLAANASGQANVTREQLEELARKVFEEAAAIDAEEDARYGADRRGDELAEGWEPGPGRAAKIREALGQLDAQDGPQRDIDRMQAERVAAGKPRLGRKRLPADPLKPGRLASRAGKRKVNLTDPDSRTLKTPKGFVQGYSAQAVADANQFVLAAAVTNEQNDNHQLHPMLQAARDNLAAAGGDPDRMIVGVADRGYWDQHEIDTIESELGITALVATVKDSKLRDGDPPGQPAPSMATMHRRFEHPVAKRIYRRRSTMIEPVFGQRKTNLNLDRFQRRGLDAVNGEWILEMTAHNLTKYWRATPATA